MEENPLHVDATFKVTLNCAFNPKDTLTIRCYDGAVDQKEFLFTIDEKGRRYSIVLKNTTLRNLVEALRIFFTIC